MDTHCRGVTRAVPRAGSNSKNKQTTTVTAKIYIKKKPATWNLQEKIVETQNTHTSIWLHMHKDDRMICQKAENFPVRGKVLPENGVDTSGSCPTPVHSHIQGKESGGKVVSGWFL